MKCDACGAPVENGKCTYCGKVFAENVDVHDPVAPTYVGNIGDSGNINPSPSKKKLGEKTWFIILMLIIFFPVGLYLMWKNANWKKGVKIVITALFVCALIVEIASPSDSNDSSSEGSTENKTTVTEEENVSTEYKNALIKAESYSDLMYMSKAAIYEQLTSEYGEGFEADAAQYAIDNLEADYNYNALMKAKTYRDDMNMSKNSIYEQLVSEYGEQFTADEAQYAIDHLDEV